jgi:hypothetical protein
MNWKTIINDLTSSGMIKRDIASDIGCSAALISELSSGKRGRRLSWEIGMRLNLLHERVCGKKED